MPSTLCSEASLLERCVSEAKASPRASLVWLPRDPKVVEARIRRKTHRILPRDQGARGQEGFGFFLFLGFLQEADCAFS